jgi:hypothetical protein
MPSDSSLTPRDFQYQAFQAKSSYKEWLESRTLHRGINVSDPFNLFDHLISLMFITPSFAQYIRPDHTVRL